MTTLQQVFNPQDVEEKWYEFWNKNNLFYAELNSPKPSFSIVIPPPNVTGSLHMGHALNATLQDILTRWKKMLGFNVLWLPGTDHAGIATQNVVEKELLKEGLSRYKLGREEFVKKIWEWKELYGGKIIHQLKKLGCACDWTRERFTLDEGLSKAVREVFVRLFEEGLLYRDNRLINWCPRCHTALSELEVEYEEIEGALYFIKYPFENSEEGIIVATTRPETMLGDTAVAVNPDDERYAKFIGRWVILPLIGRKIKVIAEPTVDKSFGTGALKVTPAHDFNDETIGKLHGLQSISVIAEDGKMNENAGKNYEGLDRFECRKKVLSDLTKLGLLVDIKKHLHSVGHCYRCKSIIEPLLSIQWYVSVSSMASEAIRAVENGSIRLIPDIWTNNYFAWMRDIKDWCISRQIWWGHQIPVWYCPDCKISDDKTQGDIIEHIFYSPVSIDNNNNVLASSYSKLRALGLSHNQIIKNSKIIRIPKEVKPITQRYDLELCPICNSNNLIRDPDVLDTWFSSALWPFSTLGWPNDTEDLKTFYPTSVLVTGFDILFFWVARMIMMGLKFMNDVPFRDVYIHALVRDQKGHKMSKSKGNVVDPLVMIAKYGTDSFRFSLAAFAAQGRDIKFSEKRVEGYRHFINKLWNASKFIANYSEFKTNKDILDYKDDDIDLFSKWILSRLNHTIINVNKELEAYRFNDAANSIYQFVWHEFCDWYIETVKYSLYKGTEKEKAIIVDCLYFVLKNILLLLHPFMPFVTEELWCKMISKNSILLQSYPQNFKEFPEAEKDMTYFIDAVSGIRHIRGELNINPSSEIKVNIRTLSNTSKDILVNNLNAMIKLTKASEINIGDDIQRTKDSAIAIRNEMEIYIPLGGLIDVESEIKRLSKEMSKIDSEISFVNKKLMNEDFLKNAPEDIIEKEKNKIDSLINKSIRIQESIHLLKAIK
ncbi:MAG: valine--tRNA ligase [Thermodesulfovibrionales bacterium]|nr:valine--tRNA ligase [Thermodesulfovibrionales bacterium]